jgi:hypothetical protein
MPNGINTSIKESEIADGLILAWRGLMAAIKSPQTSWVTDIGPAFIEIVEGYRDDLDRDTYAPSLDRMTALAWMVFLHRQRITIGRLRERLLLPFPDLAHFDGEAFFTARSTGDATTQDHVFGWLYRIDARLAQSLAALTAEHADKAAA